MKISQKLSEIRQKEGELMRLYDLRESIIKKDFSSHLIKTDDLTEKQLEEKRKEFFESKKIRIKVLDSKIDNLKNYLITSKNNINERNIELGIDKKLIEMKYLRLELSKLMKLVKNERSWTNDVQLDVDVFEELGLSERISDLESRKVKLVS